MSRQSILLLSSIPPVVTYIGEPTRVDLWYQNTQSQHTMSVAASNFRGRLIVQATIKVKPCDDDWFPILFCGRPHIDYPRNGIGTNGNSNLGGLSGGYSSTAAGYGGLGAETSTLAFNFTGRFVWMRAIVDRSHIIPRDANPVMVAACGFIDRILLNI